MRSRSASDAQRAPLPDTGASPVIFWNSTTFPGVDERADTEFSAVAPGLGAARSGFRASSRGANGRATRSYVGRVGCPACPRNAERDDFSGGVEERFR